MSLVVDQATFNQEVLGSSVPVLVNFWAPWCGVCRVMEPMLVELKSKWGERVKLVNVNADENLKLATLYKLKTLPTVLLFDQGDLHYRLEHFRGREDFQLAITDLQATLETIAVVDRCSASV